MEKQPRNSKVSGEGSGHFLAVLWLILVDGDGEVDKGFKGD